MAHTKETRARAYAKMRMLREEWLAKEGPCVSCGTWKQLEMDHIKSTDKEASTVWSWKAERREAELAKCQVLCKSCHLRKTSWTRLSRVTHSLSMYQIMRCRCKICKAAKKVERLRNHY